MGISPPVPVPRDVLGRGGSGTLERGEKKGRWRRLIREEVVVEFVDTERFRWVSGVR